jgi:alpha-glucosidase
LTRFEPRGEFGVTASLKNPPRFRLADRRGPHLVFESDLGFSAHLFVLEADIIRVALLSGPAFSMTRTWSVAAGGDDVPDGGRDRFDTSGFSAPPFEIVEEEDRTIVATDRLRVTISHLGFHCVWEMAVADAWHEIARDRPTQAYNFGWWGPKVHHYLARRATERYYGLGERSGDMDRALRRFRLKGTDAMGYNARTSDPLYKHVPFYITQDMAAATAFGLFYDTYSDCKFDFGAEISNYHGPYRSFVADSGDLDYYVIAGPALPDVVRRFTWLTGRPALLPKWALGYSGSTMSYTDAPDAQARMADFIAKCREHDILCDSFHLSSGYTSIGSQRHVFHWNREKFPDPSAFVRSYHDAGIKLCANIKPCLLSDNPLFEQARTNRLIVCDAAGEPVWTQFWDGLGAYVDFTNPAARTWWADHVKSALLDYGIDATWNDNNEFEIVSPGAVAHGFDGPLPAQDCKPLQSLLMMRSSRDAQAAFTPERRPFLVTRAGAAGMQRYAQTWSGDNYTSWETLKYNIKMGLGLALSGVSNSGHDVGGFAGPASDAELFVRWVEAGIFMPRFSIHSWNSDKTVNEPWMHPEATPTIRKLIALRYSLVPYLYDLMWRHHHDCEPIWRPAFYDFSDDPRSWDETDTYMLGANLLVALVCAPGTKEVDVYLPADANWADFWSGSIFKGGQSIAVEAPLGRTALFVRESAAVPMNAAEQHFDARADERAFAVFPPTNGTVSATCYEDDGESEAWRGGAYGFWNLKVDCADRLTVHCGKSGSLPPAPKTLAILLRPHEKRPLVIVGGKLISDEIVGDWRKAVITTEN